MLFRIATPLLIAFLGFNSSFGWSAQRENVRDKDLSSLGTQSPSSASRTLPREEQLRRALGLGSRHAFRQKKQHTDRRGNRHTRYTQLYQGVPVWGEELVVHEDARGHTRATGHIIKGLEAPATLLQSSTARITPETAFQTLTQTFGHHQNPWKISNIHNQLVVYVDESGAPRHAYYVHYLAEPVTPGTATPTRPHALVDAIKGSIIKQWEGLNHVETGTGPGGNTKTGSYEYGTDYGFLDVTHTGSTCTLENSNVRTVNLNHDTYGTAAHSFDCPRNTVKTINGAYSPLNDAHYFGNVVYDMYQEWLNIAPLAFQLIMRVHYSSGYENAFWDGSAMTFGDGGSMFYPLVDINVASHEVSHGFTEQNSNLIYYGQSGGINEAFSDIAGEAAEFYMRGSVDWFVGGDIMKSQDGLRYFADPTQDGMSIGHASNYYPGMDVHFSSGVFNRAFYLLAHTSGWDVRTAFEAFAQANQDYWGPSETFDTAACGVQDAAHDLGYNAWDVYMAFQVVGVDCGTLPFTDLDGDSMDDNWERTNGLDPENPGDATEDLDSDGLNNLIEYQLRTNPAATDSDTDSLSDYDEVNVHHTNPALADTDGDVMDDGFELGYGFDPLDNTDGREDADNDGYTNSEEYEFETDPSDAASRPAFRIHSFENGQVPPGWNIPANSGADAGWQVDASQAQQGVYSLRAAPISNSQQAIIEFTQYFSANSLSFWTRTDTEGGWDYLRVYVDGMQVLSISGSSTWTQRQINFAEGEHRIRFEYAKDGSVSSGSDTVWIDNLRFLVPDEDGDGMPNRWEEEHGLDRTDPTDATEDADADGLNNLGEYTHGSDPSMTDSDGDTLNDGVEVHTHGTSPSSVDTDSDTMNDAFEILHGLNALDARDANEDADGDGFTNADEYHYDSDPTDAASQPQVQIVSFEDGRLPPGWTLPTGSNAGWGIDSTVAQHGTHSLVSQYSSNNYYSIVEFTTEFATNSLSFWTRSNNNYCCSRLYVYVDGVEVLYQYTSSTTWQQHQINLAEGEHTVRIRYYRSNSSDRLWLDNLRYVFPDDDQDGMPNGWEERFELDSNDASDAALDADADGLSNLEEFDAGSSPILTDTDGDSLNDGVEVNEHGTSPAHRDSDGDSMNDGYEVSYGLDALDATDADEDADGDGFSNADEHTYGTLPNDASSLPVARVFSFEDGQIPNGWTFPNGSSNGWLVDNTQGQSGNQSLVSQLSSGYSILEFTDTFATGTLSFWTRAANDGCCARLYVYVDGSERYYASGLSQWQKVEIPVTEGEHTIRIRAYNSYSTDRVWLDNLRYIYPDNDRDGMTNVWEVQYGLDLNDAGDAALDADSDGLTNLEEFNAGTHPRQSDTDGDGLSDFSELRTHGTSPINVDSDDDLMEDGYELDYGFDPTDATDGSLDSDGDGHSNAEENSYDTDPTDAGSVPTYQVFSFEDGRLPPGWSEPSNSNSYNVGWATDSTVFQHGSASLVSQNNASYQPATIEFTAEFALNSLSFWTRPANDNCCGYIHVYIDNDYAYDSYSLADWQEHQIPVSEGEHTIRITYHSNSTTDHLWLDNLRFILPDNDHDGLPNDWEARHQLNPEDASDALLDADADGLSNLDEYRAATHARQTDTDGDTLSDGDEVNMHATSPLTADSDDDSMADGVELSLDLDPLDNGDGNADLDADGVSNADELAYDTAPDDADDTPNLSVFSFEDGSFPYRWTNAYQSTLSWTIDEAEGQQGSHALVSSIPDYYQASSLMFTAEFEANSLRFWSRSENGACCGVLWVYINGSEVYRHIGSRDWQEHVIPVSAGQHEVRILYLGDNSNDRLWIDNLRFILQDDDGDDMPNGWENNHGLDRNDPDDATQDADDDGLNNLDEYLHATHPRQADTDGDELTDLEEIETHHTSPTQVDSDGDTMDDGFEVAFEFDPLDASDAGIDTDGDGHTNAVEYASGTDPQDASSIPTVRTISFENGWLPGGWSIPQDNVSWRVVAGVAQDGSYALTSQNISSYQYNQVIFTAEFAAGTLSFWTRLTDNVCCGSLSVSIDGSFHNSINTSTEWRETQITVPAGTHTLRFQYYNGASTNQVLIDQLRFITRDADSDGVPNSWEQENGLNPNDASDAANDGDADGLSALEEFNAGSSLTDADADNDRLTDGLEVLTHGTSPTLSDTDGDTMADHFEVQYEFDPLDPTDARTDADGDDFSNADEHRYHSNPRDADSFPAIEVISFEDGEVPQGWVVPNTANAGWQIDATQAQQGTISLRAAPIGHSQRAQIEFTREFAAGSLIFWSRTSTEGCCDYLSVYVDGSPVLSRSGQYEWTEHQINLSEGTHTIRLEYRKDGSVVSGSDTVWIDNLQFFDLDADGDGMPTTWEVEHGLDPNDPDDAALDGDDDELSNLDEFTAGTDPDSADTDNDALLDGEEVHTHRTSPVLIDSDQDGMNDGFEVLNALDPLDDSDADEDADGDGFTNQEEHDTGADPSDPQSTPLVHFIDFENDILPKDWQIPESADAGWQIDRDEGREDSISLRSLPIGPNESAEVMFTADTLANSLSFWVKTSSEGFRDVLRVYVDNQIVLTRSGETGWQQHLIDLTSGTHTIRFEYTKDGMVNQGSDAVWIDDVRFISFDVDQDRMADAWERHFGLSPSIATDAAQDLDSDLLNNLLEYELGTHPAVADSDGDQWTDGAEINEHDTDPLNPDSDGDGVIDSVDAFPIAPEASLDADGDSLPDAWNESCNQACQDTTELELDPSASDTDNDGLPNAQDNDNRRDNNPPELTAPANISMIATGDLTTVALGAAYAEDFVDGVITATTTQSNVFTPGRHTVQWRATDRAGNSTTAIQTVDILPLATFTLSQQRVNEGGTVSVVVRLNGNAPQYPVVIPYALNMLRSTVNGADHRFVNGVLTIAAGSANQGSITIATVDDGLTGEPDEVLAIELMATGSTALSNAGLGTSVLHQVTLVEPNRAPTVQLALTQDGTTVTELNLKGSPVVIRAQVSDANPEDGHTFVWRLNGITLSVAPGASQITRPLSDFREGSNTLAVAVTDNGSPTETASASMIISAHTPEEPNESGGGGGGALSWAELLFLLMCAMRGLPWRRNA